MQKYEDTYRHKGLRKKLIDSLKEKGITDDIVLEAMNKVDELHLPGRPKADDGKLGSDQHRATHHHGVNAELGQ